MERRASENQPSQAYQRSEQSEKEFRKVGKLLKDQRIFSNGNSYYGTWLDGRMHGQGHYIWSDGSEFEGDFHQGYMWGHGQKTWPSGRKYEGEWRKDMMWGKGKMTWPSGETYEQDFSTS